MEIFTKTFNLPTHQVLYYKDEEDLENKRKGLHTTHQIIAIVSHEGIQKISYGYDVEAKRDEIFDNLTSEAANETLKVVLAASESDDDDDDDY